MSTHSDERTGDVGFRVIHRAGDPIPSDDQPYLGDYWSDLGLDELDRPAAPIAEAAASSIVRMDAAEAAADALSKYAHLLPDYATAAHEAARDWRILRDMP